MTSEKTVTLMTNTKKKNFHFSKHQNDKNSDDKNRHDSSLSLIEKMIVNNENCS